MPRPRQPAPAIHKVSINLDHGSVEYIFHHDVDGLMMTELSWDWRGVPTSIVTLPIDTAIAQMKSIRASREPK